MLIACVDVDYRETEAVAAGVWFRGWGASEPEQQFTTKLTGVAAYEPGAFYRRELPCLLAVLKLGPRADLVIVDGYVWLGADQPGLGAHLHSAIGGMVIGVGKTRFASASSAVPLCRGDSRAPLYISAAGLPIETATDYIAQMHGLYRVPTLLKLVDHLARTAI